MKTMIKKPLGEAQYAKQKDLLEVKAMMDKKADKKDVGALEKKLIAELNKKADKKDLIVLEKKLMVELDKKANQDTVERLVTKVVFMDERLVRVENRLDGIDEKLDHLVEAVDGIAGYVKKHDAEIAALTVGLQRLDGRVTALEAR